MSAYKPRSCLCEYPTKQVPTGSGHRKDCPAHQEWLERKKPKPRAPGPPRPPRTTDGVNEKLLGLIHSTSPMDFGELCGALKNAGMYPAEKAEWRQIFEELEMLEGEGLVEIDRAGEKIDTLQLTTDGADRVRAALDENRGLLRLQEEG